jgi:hypothetical protein
MLVPDGDSSLAAKPWSRLAEAVPRGVGLAEHGLFLLQ